MKYACAYALNDVVVPVKDYRRYGMQRREQYRVVAQDIAANRLTLVAADGRTFEFDPATCAEKSVYEVQQLTVAPGEQLRWMRNEAVAGVRNGQVVTVESIDTAGNAILYDSKGERMSVRLTGQQYLDYALVSTTYGSQGKMADRVLAAIDSTLSKEGLYVAVSRAKSDLSLYTTDKAELYRKAQRSAANNNPSDFLTLFEMVNPDVQQKSTEPARPLRGADQSEHAGDCVAGSFEARVRGSDYLARGGQPVERTAASLTRSIGREADRARHRAMVNRVPYRQQYQQYAAGYAGSSATECDRFVVRQMVSELLERSNGRSLTTVELKQVALVVGQGPTTQQLKRAEGRAASVRYVAELTVDEKRAIEKVQQTEAATLTQSQKQVAQKEKPVQLQKKNQKQQRSQGSGLEL